MSSVGWLMEQLLPMPCPAEKIILLSVDLPFLPTRSSSTSGDHLLVNLQSLIPWIHWWSRLSCAHLICCALMRTVLCYPRLMISLVFEGWFSRHISCSSLKCSKYYAYLLYQIPWSLWVVWKYCKLSSFWAQLVSVDEGTIASTKCRFLIFFFVMYTNQESRSEKFWWEPLFLYDLGDAGEASLQCSGIAGKLVSRRLQRLKGSALTEMYSKFQFYMYIDLYVCSDSTLLH